MGTLNKYHWQLLLVKAVLRHRRGEVKFLLEDLIVDGFFSTLPQLEFRQLNNFQIPLNERLLLNLS
jgi:hypothetical protein